MTQSLSSRLAGLRRRLRLIVTFRGISWLVSIAVLAAAAGGSVDWLHPLPSLVRALILVGALSAVGYVAYRFLVQPLGARLDDLSLALRIERLYPSLNDGLASAVQFLEQAEESEQSGAPGLRRAAVQHSLRQAGECDFSKVVSSRGVRLAGVSLVAATALAVGLVLAFPALARTALVRLADPFGNHEWPRQTQVQITDFRARVARGEAYEIHALITGVIPDYAEIDSTGLSPARATYPLARELRGHLVARLEHVEHDFQFQVRANDAVSERLEVAVMPPPVLVPWQGLPSPQVHLDYPAYTLLPAQDLPDGSGNIEAVAGTRVTLRAATDRPVSQAWIEYRPEQPLVSPAAFLGALGSSHPAGALALTAIGQDVWDRIPVRIEGSVVLAAEFLPRVSGLYGLHFEDESGLGNTRLFDLKIRPDPVPTVNLERPSRSHDSLDVLPEADVHVQVLAEDKEYALRSIYLEYRCRKSSERKILENLAPESPLQEARPERMPLYDPPSSGAAAPVPPRPQQSKITRLLSLKEVVHADHGPLQEGDRVVLQACADDFDDVTVDKPPGRSHEIELRIVSRATLEAILNKAQAEVQQELLRARKLQQEALEHVIGPEQHWRNTGRLQPRDMDRLRQAEQLQQQVRARLGKEDEGLSTAVARILETLRDNHLPRTSAHERMETLTAELERLAREELEQIEPQLTNARKEEELKQFEQQSSNSKEKKSAAQPKPAAGARGPLGEARKHQEEVENTLNDLLKLLEPWGNVNELKGETKTLLEEQRKLRDETDQLRHATLGQSRESLDPETKAALDRIAELQNKLAERAEQLLQQMGRVSHERQEKAPATANALKEAASQGRDVSRQMKEAGQDVRDNQLSKAGDQQKNSVQALEKMVQALEEQRDKDLDRLRKGLKATEQKLADLSRRQDELHRKAKAAAQVRNPAERERQLKELAREQAHLRQEAQNMVRELTRLRAEQAGDALSRAGSSMEQAGQKMGQGQMPDEPQDEVLDRLKEAQRRLKQAQAEVAEELAREKLARLADQVKLLKERQEAALAESNRLQQEALKHNAWTHGLQSSLRNQVDVQQGLAQETEDLAHEKLAAAPVLAHLLVRSADSMKQASLQIRKHCDQLKDRAEDMTEDRETARLQQDAAHRLAQLLDALKSVAGLAKHRSSAGAEERPASRPADDGIPPLAQLKLLRSLQEEVNQRTETFGKKHPQTEKLSAEDQQELQGIHQDQQEVADLMEELIHPAEPEGGKK